MAAPEDPVRDRRARAVLVAGVLAVVLALAGLTYALLDRDNGSGDGGSGAQSGTATESTYSSSPSGTTDAESGAPPPASSSAASRSAQPAQSVHVTLAGSYTEYNGTCPPPPAQAPTFTATFTVGRLPAQVEYRWVLAHGSVSDPGWQTLAFPSGGGRTKQVTVTVTAYPDSGTLENEISVEVRSPVRTTSNAVPFSVTCTTSTETPTDGASASPSASP
jgi:hypothetical protein